MQPGQGVYVLVGYTEYEHGGTVSGASGSLLAETVRLVWQNGTYVVDYSETLNDAVVMSSHGVAHGPSCAVGCGRTLGVVTPHQTAE